MQVGTKYSSPPDKRWLRWRRHGGSTARSWWSIPAYGLSHEHIGKNQDRDEPATTAAVVFHHSADACQTCR